MGHDSIDIGAAGRLLALAGMVAAVPMAWWAFKAKRTRATSQLALLTALTMFLTFDLIVFGAFTRLTDSGLGCPDWPGCYGQASPMGARQHIAQAQSALPSGPVTWSKAWIEMLHRYLAMAVGLLIMLAAALAWRARRQLPHSPWWAWATLVWVVVQGLFGRYTVTLKLYPAIVTLHLLGALVLLALLVVQHESFRHRTLRLSFGIAPVAAVLVVVMVQAALGGWVSTNYAVLACQGFPTCNGSWWPPTQAWPAFEILRPLGRTAEGAMLPAEALVTIHYVHRLFAVVATMAVLWLAAALWRSPDVHQRVYGRLLVGLLLAQLLSGLSNVVLGWPLAAALAHSAGAAALVGVLTSLLARGSLAARGFPGGAAVPVDAPVDAWTPVRQGS